jgi:hypothetical protein
MDEAVRVLATVPTRVGDTGVIEAVVQEQGAAVA